MSSVSTFKALASKERLEILVLLKDKGPMTAGELTDYFDGYSKPRMSAHFKVLKDAGLIVGTRHGQSIEYDLTLGVLEDALRQVIETAIALHKGVTSERGLKAKPKQDRQSPKEALAQHPNTEAMPVGYRYRREEGA